MVKKILIVEDEDFVTELLRINLTRRGYEVITAASGEEAVEVLQSVIPDLVLLDIKLPGIDGWEVCNRIKGNPSMNSVQIIVLSAAAQKYDIQQAKACGAVRFISKPFDIVKLLAAIVSLTK